MTTKEHKALAKRLVLRAIQNYKQKLIYEEDLLNGEDKRHILDEIDRIRDSIKFDKDERTRWKEYKRGKLLIYSLHLKLKSET